MVCRSHATRWVVIFSMWKRRNVVAEFAFWALGWGRGPGPVRWLRQQSKGGRWGTSVVVQRSRLRFQCGDAWLPSRVRALTPHVVPTKQKKEKKMDGWSSIEPSMCRRKNFGVIGAAWQWAGLPLEVGMFIGLRLETLLLARPYGDTRNSRVGWEIRSLSGSQTQLLLDLQTETPQVLVKIMPAQCGLKFISLAPSLTRNHKFFAGAQYDAETALHASWQDCGPVRQGEVNSWENPREGNEEERVNTVDFILEDFCLFMFCVFPQFSCLFRPRKNLVLAVFSSLKMISENKRPAKLKGVTEVERGALFKFYRCGLMK